MATINEKTSVQLWGVLFMMPVLAGGIGWLTTIYSDGQAHATQIRQLDTRIDRLDSRLDNEYALLMDIKEHVIRIEQHNKDKGNNND